MRANANWKCYQSLDPRKHGGKYVVIVKGKLIGSGRDLTKLLVAARREDPKAIPFVARMRDPRHLCVYDLTASLLDGTMCS